MISVIGLGAGDFEQLPLGIYRLLKGGHPLFLRTKEHPVVKELEAEGITYRSFDEVYEKYERFEDVYKTIVEILLEESQTKDIIYAVPGHPLVAEQTVQLLLEQTKDLKIVGGQSFLDAMFTSLKIDPIEGFQFVDATSFKRDVLQLENHLIFCQVYDRFVASEVKLALMEELPDEQEVVIVTAAGSKDERVEKVPLYELDRMETLSNLTSVYVPPVRDLPHRFATLRQIIATLRGENGCPWDKKQTHQSLKKYLLEESYELLEAIDQEDDDHIVEELGDVLLQVMLHSQIGDDEGMFSIDDVIRGLSEKMIRRHPHIFGDVSLETADEVVANWNLIKETEKDEQSLFERIPKSLPSTMTSYEYYKASSKLGFNWGERNADLIWGKISEEITEFKQEVVNKKEQAMMLEFGDILCTLISIAYYHKINPEEALAKVNAKNLRRFLFVEQQLKEHGMIELNQKQLWDIWAKAKERGK